MLGLWFLSEGSLQNQAHPWFLAEGSLQKNVHPRFLSEGSLQKNAHPRILSEGSLQKNAPPSFFPRVPAHIPLTHTFCPKTYVVWITCFFSFSQKKTRLVAIKIWKISRALERKREDAGRKGSRAGYPGVFCAENRFYELLELKQKYFWKSFFFWKGCFSKKTIKGVWIGLLPFKLRQALEHEPMRSQLFFFPKKTIFWNI